MRRLESLIALLAMSTLVACGGGSSGTTAPPPTPPGGGGSNTSVTVGNNFFQPATATVPAGSTVAWTWNSCANDVYGNTQCTPHSVTFDDGGPSSQVQSSGTFSRTFNAGGTYTYYCTVHGRNVMSGSVVVQ